VCVCVCVCVCEKERVSREEGRAVERELWGWSCGNTDSLRKRIMFIFNKTMPLHISPNLRTHMAQLGLHDFLFPWPASSSYLGC